MRIGKANGGDWLRLTEAARLLGIGQSTLRRWSDTGQLTCYRSAGGHRRYRRADVEAALAIQGDVFSDAWTAPETTGPAGGDATAPDRCLRAARALSEPLATLTRVAVDGIGCGAAVVALVDGDDLEVMADHARLGVACRLRRGQRCALDEAPATALAIRECRRVVIADLAGTTLLSARQTGLYRGLGHTALLAAPLVAQGRTIGALELVDTGAPRAFTSADVAFAEFVARQASLLVAEECGTAPPGPVLRVTPSASSGAGPPGDPPPSLSTGSPAIRSAPAGLYPPGSSGVGRLDKAGPLAKASADLVADLQRRNEELTRIVAAGLHDVAGVRPDEVIRSLLRRISELTHTPVVDVYAVEGSVMRALASFDGGRFDADWEGVVLPLARYPCSLRAVDTREATVVTGLEDAGLSDEDRYSLEKWGYQAQLSLPLVTEGRVIGLLELSDYAARDFAPELDVIRGLGAAATQAVRSVTLLEQVERRNRILGELVGIGSRASAEHDPSRALAHVAERVLATVGAAGCDIYGLDEGGFRCLASHDRSGPDEAPRGTLLDVESYPTLAADIAARRTFVLTSPDDPRLGAEERRLYREHGFASEIAVPLVASGRLFGLLDVYDTCERDYGEYLGFLQTIAGGLAGKMEVQAILAALEQRGRTQAALVELTAAAAQADTPRELAVTVATRLREATAMARCDVYGLDGGLLRCLASVDERGLDDCGPDFEFAIDDFPATAMSVRTGEPLAIARLDADPRLTPEERAHYAEGGFRSELCLPLTLDGRVLGLIDLFDRRSRDLSVMAELAGPVARFVAGLHDTLVRLGRDRGATVRSDASPDSETRDDAPETHEREMRLLDEIASAAGAGRELRDIAAAGLTRLRTLLAFERAAVAVRQGDGRFAWVHAVGEGGRPDELDGDPDHLDVPPDVLRRERVIVFEQRSAPAPVPAREHPSPAQTAVAALLAGDELIGALRVESAAGSAFTPADRRLLSRVAAQLALAITSAELYGRVRQVHHSNLKALSGALNAKDYYTLGHAARVAAYMVLLGRELGWGREALRHVEEAAYLHDIGKIAVSDRVLLKAGGLNHREWDLMRQHPIFSAQIIQPLFDHELVAGVRHHHERWDGQGYPDGLAGDEIPLLARAMCVVDSYDAMSLRRPYRQARAYEECLSELRQCAGTHFDPELVGAFLRVLDRLRTTKRAASEVARLAAARVDPAAHARLGTLEDETTPSYEAIVSALREVRDAHPPTRFVTTLARHGRRAVVVVDAEDEGSPQRSHIGDEVPFDDDLDAVFSGRALDSNTLYVDQFGVWVSAVEAIRDRGGATIAVAAADLPVEGDGEMETLRSAVSEAFAAMLELGTGQSVRSELEAVVDSLTGLYTHRYFHERLSEELERCRTQRTSLAVLLLDLDDFRAFNEHHGHSAGDGALRAVAHVVESSVRRIDVAARYGGEEFAALLIDTDEPGAIEVAERIRDGIAAVGFGADGESLSVSIGVATYPGDASFKDELLDKADWAMHLAKRQGRDAAVAFSAEHGPGQAGPAAGIDPLYVAALSDLVAAGDLHRRRRRAAVAQIALAAARELGLDPAAVRASMSSAADAGSATGDGSGAAPEPGRTAQTLVAVTAGFAAMVAEPPYRPGVSEAEALERLLRCPALRGDRRLAEAFADAVGRRRAP